MIDNYIFPFSNIVDEDLFDVFHFDEIFQQEAHESFDPFTVQDDNYNNDLDVNQFYIRSRHVEFPKSEYTFLKNFPFFLCNNNVFNNYINPEYSIHVHQFSVIQRYSVIQHYNL